MDDKGKGCILVSVVVLCGTAAIYFLVVTIAILETIDQVAQHFATSVAHSIQIFEFLLACLSELVKYLLTPFAPFLLAMAPSQK